MCGISAGATGSRLVAQSTIYTEYVHLKARDAQTVLERPEEHIRFDVSKPEDRFDWRLFSICVCPRLSSDEVLMHGTWDSAVTIPDVNERISLQVCCLV